MTVRFTALCIIVFLLTTVSLFVYHQKFAMTTVEAEVASTQIKVCSTMCTKRGFRDSVFAENECYCDTRFKNTEYLGDVK